MTRNIDTLKKIWDQLGHNRENRTCEKCGCSQNNPCNHPEFGACWWVNDDEDICSHCIELADDPAVERPNDNLP